MNDLAQRTIEAHGGLDLWHSYEKAEVHIATGGALWSIKGQEGIIDYSTVTVDLHEPRASHAPFGVPELRSVYTPERVRIEDQAGTVLEERADPRQAFAGHGLMTSSWDRLHLAYFAGYAMWNYVTAPFTFAMPGFDTRELSPWEEDGETWRRLAVTFPDSVPSHSREQVYYIDANGWIRRHDYVAEVLGSDATTTAHYSEGHKTFDGIVVPTRRTVYLLDENGVKIPEPVIVSIDVENVTFS